MLIFSFSFSQSESNSSEEKEENVYSLGKYIHFFLSAGYVGYYSDFLNDDLKKAYSIGFGVYGRLVANLYMGIDFYYIPRGDVNISGYTVDYSHAPLEVNLKYSFDTGTLVVVDLGMGVSMSRLTATATALGVSESQWYYGFQPFVNVNFKFNMFYFGVGSKYQYVQKSGEGLRNYRVGGHIGMLF